VVLVRGFVFELAAELTDVQEFSVHTPICVERRSVYVHQPFHLPFGWRAKQRHVLLRVLFVPEFGEIDDRLYVLLHPVMFAIA
jgi:hypothetical protein